MANLTQTRLLTAKEYFEQYPETNAPIELIEGEVIMSPAPAMRHQKAVLEIAVILRNFVATSPIGQVFISPADVEFDEHDVLQPDVFFIASDNKNCQVQEEGNVVGAPDLCVEVVSPSSVRRDRHTKPKIYAKHGVREYWLIEPEAKFVEIYVLQDGAYRLQGEYGEGETFTSALLPTLNINVSDIFKGQN